MDTALQIRYKCNQPARLHGKSGEDLFDADFTCNPKEPEYVGKC